MSEAAIARSSPERSAPEGSLLSIGDLPGVLREIAEVAGVEAALRIAELRGGARMSIPAHVTPDCWLALAIGETAAARVSSHFTSGYTSQSIDVPLGPRGARASVADAMRKMIADGVSGERIARQLGVAARTVRRTKARMKRDAARAKKERL